MKGEYMMIKIEIKLLLDLPSSIETTLPEGGRGLAGGGWRWRRGEQGGKDI